MQKGYAGYLFQPKEIKLLPPADPADIECGHWMVLAPDGRNYEHHFTGLPRLSIFRQLINKPFLFDFQRDLLQVIERHAMAVGAMPPISRNIIVTGGEGNEMQK